MFDPISARLASSFSRNGIRLAATETSCFGLTSMYSISSAMLQHEVAGLAGVDQLGSDAALLVQRHVGLRDDVLVFFPRRKIVAMGFEFGVLLLARRAALLAFSSSAREAHLADFEIGVAGVQDLRLRPPPRRLSRGDTGSR